MASSSYINYDAIKNDINLDGKKFFAIAVTVAIVFGANYALNLNEKIDSDKKTIDEMINSLASLQEQINQNKQQNQEKFDVLSEVTSTSAENITLLAANTNTKVAAVKRSIIAVSKDVVAVSNKVSVVEKKALSIEERTRAIEQAVDMPGANPMDSLITNYEQR
jgi:TolA-binding protein